MANRRRGDSDVLANVVKIGLDGFEFSDIGNQLTVAVRIIKISPLLRHGRTTGLVEVVEEGPKIWKTAKGAVLLVLGSGQYILVIGPKPVGRVAHKSEAKKLIPPVLGGRSVHFGGRSMGAEYTAGKICAQQYPAHDVHIFGDPTHQIRIRPQCLKNAGPSTFRIVDENEPVAFADQIHNTGRGRTKVRRAGKYKSRKARCFPAFGLAVLYHETFRAYPFGSAGTQQIGPVAPAFGTDAEAFALYLIDLPLGH